MKLVEERLFNLLNRTEKTTPRLAARADFIYPTYIGLDKKGIFHFKTNSQSRPGHNWYQTIEIKNFATLVNSVDEITPELIEKWFTIADVNVFCTDESFLYWALQYMATQRDYVNPEYPENRAPKRNNVKLNGGLCKHLTAIAEAIESGEYYEQMAKDATNWRSYAAGQAYKSFSKGRLMGQAKKKEKEIDWRKLDSFMNQALWAKHGIARFLRQYNIKKSIADEVERIRATGEDPTIDEFLDDAFAMTTTELAQAAEVDQKAIDDFFRQNFGFTD